MAKPDLAPYRSRMDKSIDLLKEEYGGLRTGRANSGLIEHVQVEAYGSTVPLNSVGAISVPEPRMISVSVWDKSMVTPVEKAIRNAGLGLNPLVDGMTLRIPVPALTEERRKDLAKLAGKYAEQQRIAVRNVRREAMEDMKKAEKSRRNLPGRPEEARDRGAGFHRRRDQAHRRSLENQRARDHAGLRRN